ncbi:helix-turn-helix domain-containing protein [Saccharothrix sp. S26]|uniref:helix-turn-helix domain-containing protein n=1 Tax=Saccharothrix sp. S26 TaxID=2907215 RepID=UPI001F3F8662|nr:helix-turn-helix domain-containing protein [Saccharothrix sp. S26]MCE6996469.1 helix-turn-helix domain-containing protein [Saccharothrix sp. S26]
MPNAHRPSAGGDPATQLGRELLRLRTARGLSLRRLARLLGMTAHSGLVDYERGLRIPPRDLMSAYIRVLSPHDDGLLEVYRAALDSRAARRVAAFRPLAPVPAEGRVAPDHLAEHHVLTGLAQTLENVADQLRVLAAAWVAPGPEVAEGTGS